MFSKIEIVPRWIIFTIDICLCVFSLLLAKIVKHNFIVEDINGIALYRSVILVAIVNVLVFFNVKTFAGIVRYTSAQDSFRILFAIALSSLIIFFSNALLIVFGSISVLSNVTIVIYSLFSFLFLITYRILVKYFFMYIKNAKLNKIGIIIYGAGEAGVATKRTFDHDKQVNKTIFAFVDDDLRKVGKTIDGVKILYAGNLEALIKKHAIDELIFASYTIPVERKNLVVDICLENKVKILNIPPPEIWARGDISTAQIQNINIEDLLDRKSIVIDTDGIQNQLKEKRILITGAAGSIGSEIVRQLMKFETGLIIMCDQNETALHELYLEMEETHQETNFHAFIGDVKDQKRMNFLFDTFKPHYVYHAAAYKHVPMMEDNPAEAIKTNVLGTKTIADLSIKHGVSKFVMISTDKAVNPTNIMGASKRIAEIYVQSLNNSLNNPNLIFSNGLSYLNEPGVKPITKFITTRFGNVLGSNGSVIPRFKQQIEKGGPITVTHPEITRFFMTIPEACRLVLEAGCMGKGGEVYVFDMGKSVKIIELAKRMILLAGLVPNEDIKITYTGLRPGEKLFEELLNDHENTMPTHHEKIMIGRVREYVFNDIQSQIYELLDLAITNDNTKLVTQMKMIVPEFKSKNSVFEKLDQVH
ncbi:nucleoside-diphosphate sugar epimerase/dehydratase [Pedobacter metabolipauper]|uniref:FlaA1/EpsC-like NDP-sugar epimerase n=1 Tax=Pedobacter metabolipauper TaxID=425513 RepID=A0A4R6SVP4_9SPHI|nr:nucleoside-diphosphate sugar epimerase/dehydratase [Pedobacter metabolipauper]TDQ09948.1 FlaA1/EpsC-like NDP-sugar epimerase [Pedobacter metabolipauper]